MRSQLTPLSPAPRNQAPVPPGAGGRFAADFARKKRRWIAVGVLCCVLFGVGVYNIYFFATKNSAARAPAPTGIAGKRSGTLPQKLPDRNIPRPARAPIAKALADIAVIDEALPPVRRDLFNPSPAAALKTQKENEKEKEEPSFVLSGTMITENAAVAFVNGIALGQGDLIEGFTVAVIQTDRVVLKNDSEKITVYAED